MKLDDKASWAIRTQNAESELVRIQALCDEVLKETLMGSPIAVLTREIKMRVIKATKALGLKIVVR